MTRDEQAIYLFALRYSFGRDTYAFGLVKDEIVKHIKDFEEWQRQQIVKEVKQAAVMYDSTYRLTSWTDANKAHIDELIKACDKEVTQ